MKIKVSVPATSANIGSGFDALGLAVTLGAVGLTEKKRRNDPQWRPQLLRVIPKSECPAVTASTGL